MVKKLKVYLDTSVISHLAQTDAPEKMADTQKLWKMFINNVFDVCLSTVTLQEIDDCSEPKRSVLWRYLNQIQYETYDVTDEALDIVDQIISMRVLTNKSYDDCRHIGIAVSSNCDCIISWNFKHIVNIKTIRGVRTIAGINGYRPIEICSPSTLLNWED